MVKNPALSVERHCVSLFVFSTGKGRENTSIREMHVLEKKMKHLRGVLVFVGLLACLFFAVACRSNSGSSANPLNPEPTPTVSDLTGIVTFQGQPSADVVVYLVKPQTAIETGIAKFASKRALVLPDPAFGEFRTTTGTDGSFHFSQVPVGEYNLVAVRDAQYQSIQPGIIVGSVTVIDVQLTPTGSLTGTVSVPATTDLANVLVFLEGTSYLGITDSSGAFTLANIPAGKYRLKAMKDDVGLLSGMEVTVLPAQTVAAGVIPLVSLVSAVTGNITGTAIRNLDSGATVSSTSSGDHGGTLVHLSGTQFVTFTDTTGSYRFSGIPSGTYILTFPSETYTPTTRPTVTVIPGATTTAPAVTLTLKTSNSPFPTTANSALGGLTGNVLLINPNLPPANHIVGVQISSAGMSLVEYSDPGGRFAFKNIPTGDYALNFIVQGYASASPTPVLVTAGVVPPAYGPFHLLSVDQLSTKITGTVLPAMTSGTTMELFRIGMSVPYATVLLKNGSEFLFDQVDPGEYYLQLDPLSGYSLTAPADQVRFVISQGQTIVRNGLTYSNTAPIIYDHLLFGTILSIQGDKFATGPGFSTVKANQTILPRVDEVTWMPSWIQVDVASLPAGVYSLTVENPDGAKGVSTKNLVVGLPMPAVSMVMISQMGMITVLEILGENFNEKTEIYGDQTLLPAYDKSNWTSGYIAADITSVEPGSYYLTVKNADGSIADNGPPNDTFTVSIPAPTLDTPVVRDTEVTLTWQAVNGASTYEVWEVSPSWNFVANVYGMTYTYTNLTPDTDYTLGIIAVGDSVQSSRSDVSVTTKRSIATEITLTDTLSATNFRGCHAQDGSIYLYVPNSAGTEPDLTVYSLMLPLQTSQGYTLGADDGNLETGENFHVGTGKIYMSDPTNTRIVEIALDLSLGSIFANDITGNFAGVEVLSIGEDNSGNKFVLGMRNTPTVFAQLVKYDSAFSNPVTKALSGTLTSTENGKVVFSQDYSQVILGFAKPSAVKYGKFQIIQADTLADQKALSDACPSTNSLLSIDRIYDSNRFGMLNDATISNNFRLLNPTDYSWAFSKLINVPAKQFVFDKLGRAWMIVDDTNPDEDRVDVYSKTGELVRSFFLPSSGTFPATMTLDRSAITFDTMTEQVVLCYNDGSNNVKLLVMDASFNF
jgi:hypothetical protein